MTGFSANKEEALFIFIYVAWQRHICQLNYQKPEGCVVNLPLPFLVTKDQGFQGKRYMKHRNRKLRSATSSRQNGLHKIRSKFFYSYSNGRHYPFEQYPVPFERLQQPPFEIISWAVRTVIEVDLNGLSIRFPSVSLPFVLTV